MGDIFAKFRKEKSTEAVLEALQEKINTLEMYTVNIQEQKKRIVGNFLAFSIAVYVVAFSVFYFAYFPCTWKDMILYCIPMLLFPIIIILLRYLFTWYFQRKLNKNSKKLTAIKDERKKILEQVIYKETYKVAVNLLARYADKPSKPFLALSANTPNTPLLNCALQNTALTQTSQQLSACTTLQIKTGLSLTSPMARINAQVGLSSSPLTVSILNSSSANQQLRRRTPFPIVNQQEKGVFDRIVDVIVGDGPQDRFAMICKECYSHNGMALNNDFEYTTFRCAFCNALNPSRKNRPIAPRLSVMPPCPTITVNSDTSDAEDDNNDSENEALSLNVNKNQFTPEKLSFVDDSAEDNNTPGSMFSTFSNPEDENTSSEISSESDKVIVESKVANSSFDELLKKLEKSDSAIEDISMSPE